MIPRLQAEASLDAAREIAVGTGSLKDGAGSEIVNSWQAIAFPQETRRKQPTTLTEAEGKRLGLKLFKPKKRTAE